MLLAYQERLQPHKNSNWERISPMLSQRPGKKLRLNLFLCFALESTDNDAKMLKTITGAFCTSLQQSIATQYDLVTDKAPASVSSISSISVVGL